MHLKDANGMTNGVDPNLIWVNTVCQNLSTRKPKLSAAEFYNVLFQFFDKSEYYIPLESESSVLSP